MNILIAPDKFKGSLTARQVCRAIEKGLKKQSETYNITSHPMADGGDGSLDILKDHLNLTEHVINTIDPLSRPIKASYYTSDDAAFIEVAAASGLVILDKYDRNPLITSTRGTGYLIKDAIDRGFDKIYLFLGGSATNDGGMGIAHALGFDILDENGDQLDPSGHSLSKVRGIRNNNVYDFESIEILLFCDVTNPMHGPEGAAYAYASQKGAEPWAIELLDSGLQNLDDVLKKEVNKELADIPGMGAAGAIGACLVGLCRAEIRSGFDMIARLTDLEDRIAAADVVISGEGKLDNQSLHGKLVDGIALICKKKNKSIHLLVGKNDLSSNEVKHLNIKSVSDIAERAINLEDAMNNAGQYLEGMASDLSL